MPIQQTKDILDHAHKFHLRLGQFYTELLEQAPAERTCGLLEHLIEHEQTLAHRLKDYEQGVSKNILDTFFRYTTDGVEAHFSNYEKPLDITPQTVIEAARFFDESLTHFYQEMASKAISEKVKEVLLNLLDMELQEQMSLSKQALELRSIHED